MSTAIKFYFQWVGRRRVRLGARIGDASYADEFPVDTKLSDALEAVRHGVIRKATGLPETDETENNRELDL